MLEFKDFDLSGIGARASKRDAQWATLMIHLTDTETDHCPSIDVKLLVPKRPDATLHEIEGEARTAALAILKAAIDLLEGSSLAELRAREEAAEDAEEAKRLATLASLGLGGDGQPLKA